MQHGEVNRRPAALGFLGEADKHLLARKRMPFVTHFQRNAIYTSARAFRLIRCDEHIATWRRSPVVEILAFDRRFDRSSFSYGKPDLDDWLKRQAGQQERANNTRTFLAVEGHQIIGYYATTTYRLGLNEAAAMFGVGRRGYPIPAVLLARLAVDSSCQGSGVGSKLLFHALMQIAAASDMSASRS
jgi:hypothetical protein